MGKIIKKSVEKITLNKQKFSLGMKGEFKIEFANDSFGPYRYKFERTDCYFNDGIEDRGTKVFPLRNKVFDNTEIFIETDDVVITVGERGSLTGGEDKTFIDVINIKTEKKYRLFTEEVNLIYNEQDKVVINAKDEGVFKTLVLNLYTMEKIGEVEEEIQAFFKCLYNVSNGKWYLLDFNVDNEDEKDEEKKYKKGFFIQKDIGVVGIPESFDRKKFEVITNKGKINIWENSIK